MADSNPMFEHGRTATPSLHEFIPPFEMDTLLDTLEEGLVLLDADLRVKAVNDAVLTDTGASEQDLVGVRLDRLIEVRDFDRIWSFADAAGAVDPLTIRDGALKTVDTGHHQAEFTFLARRHSPGPDGVMMRYQLTEGETDRQRRQHRQERLGLVNQFNTTLRRVSRSIIDPTSRADLEEIVCAELATARPYEFAVIIESTPRGSGLQGTPRAWAGIEEDSLADLLDPIDTEDGAPCPISEAMATGEIQSATQITQNPSVAACLAELSMDIASVAVVPIQYKDTNYGVLAVYAARDGPFEDYELGMLEELGEIVGFAYNAVDKDELLATDAVVELEFQVTDPASLLVTASVVGRCGVSLESVVPAPDGTLLHYLRLEGGDPEGLVAVAPESPSVEAAELIRSHDDVSWAVVKLSGPSAVEVLSANNVNVRSIDAEGGVARLRVEVSPTTDIDSVVTMLNSLYESFELVGKRRRERPAFTTAEFRHEVLDRLTGKQQNALEAAYQSGYFDRPRGSTAEEIADHLDISSSTFHQHIRAAMSKVMTILLESETGHQSYRRL